MTLGWKDTDKFISIWSASVKNFKSARDYLLHPLLHINDLK
jgi:hypothetical protein